MSAGTSGQAQIITIMVMERTVTEKITDTAPILTTHMTATTSSIPIPTNTKTTHNPTPHGTSHPPTKSTVPSHLPNSTNPHTTPTAAQGGRTKINCSSSQAAVSMVIEITIRIGAVTQQWAKTTSIQETAMTKIRTMAAMASMGTLITKWAVLASVISSSRQEIGPMLTSVEVQINLLVLRIGILAQQEIKTNRETHPVKLSEKVVFHGKTFEFDQ